MSARIGWEELIMILVLVVILYYTAWAFVFYRPQFRKIMQPSARGTWALNVLHGMRRAKKEGRWMGIAPFGYKNKAREDGRKYIAVCESEAAIMKWAFEEVAKRVYYIEHIHAQAKLKGFNYCKAHFWRLIRNPVYCGKVNLPAFKDEPARHVAGLHDPIISEDLFYRVQDFLDGKKLKYGTDQGGQEIFQLRGFVVCPDCGKILTSSSSTGCMGKKYYYYHCHYTCGFRFRAEDLNRSFSNELRKYVPRPGMVEAYSEVLNKQFRDFTKLHRADLTSINEQLDEANQNVVKARKRLLKEEIDANDFREIKADAEKTARALEARLFELSKETVNINGILVKALQSLSKLDQIYANSDIKAKRRIISSIYPEKCIFDGRNFRTNRINEAVG